MNEYLIKIWPFYKAPKKYQKLSNNGGDEDWIAFIPEKLKDEYISFLGSHTFDEDNVETHTVKGGIIKIASHA